MARMVAASQYVAPMKSIACSSIRDISTDEKEAAFASRRAICALSRRGQLGWNQSKYASKAGKQL